jgi:hypothetical protein
MHAVFHGVTQNQFMATHRANHVQVAYVPYEASAKLALATKASMLHEVGFKCIYVAT